MRAIKDIEKLTKGNLDVKQLDLDLGSLRKWQHTPKNGVRVPVNAGAYLKRLEEQGLLLFDPSTRPSQIAMKMMEESV